MPTILQRIICACALFLFAISYSSRIEAQDGQGLRSAESLLEYLQEQPDESEQPADEEPASDSQVTKLLANADNLDDVELGKQWAALVRKALTSEGEQAQLTPEQMMEIQMNAGAEAMAMPGYQELVTLPHPRSWPTACSELDKLATELEEKDKFKALTLRLISSMLAGDIDRIVELNKTLRTEVKSKLGDEDHPLAYSGLEMVTSMQEFILKAKKDPVIFEQVINTRISEFESEELAKQLMESYSDSLDLPDIVVQLGEQKATPYLERALKLPVPVEIEENTKTFDLAQKIALQQVDSAKVASWSLCADYSATALYEAYVGKFKPSGLTKQPQNLMQNMSAELLQAMRFSDQRGMGGDDGAFLQYAGYYVVGLVMNDRVDDAIAFVEKHDVFAQKNWYTRRALSGENIHPKHHLAIQQFLLKILDKQPQTQLWHELIHYSAMVNDVEAATALLEKKINDPETSIATSLELEKVKSHAVVAKGDVGEAVKHFKQQVKAGTPAVKSAAFAGLYRIADATEDAQLLEETLKGFEEFKKSQHAGTSLDLDLGDLVGGYTNLKQYDKAMDALAKSLKDLLASKDEYGNYESISWQYREPTIFLAMMVSIYVQAGQYEDAISLLENATWWGAKDLGKIAYFANGQVAEDGWNWKTQRNLEQSVAFALMQLGRNEDALRVITAALEKARNDDETYRLLIKLNPPDLLARLDRYAKLSPFEERPLIWKAEALRTQGKLDEALKTINAAISIDPSDGEQPRGRRMHAYTVMADIQADMGNAKDAAFFRDVVAAIRMSERADGLAKAGLTAAALDMYRDSLDLFSGAYCIQSRLAIKLAEDGKMDEAAKHYRKAFELMPDSFGRIESHCFGCEGVFQGELAQRIALEVLTERAEKTPDNPRVYYLLGLLQQEIGQPAEAIKSLELAVTKDPDYYNAWQRIFQQSDSIHAPAALVNKAIFAMIRLDPSSERTYWGLVDSVTDFKGLYLTVDRLQTPESKMPKTVYTLTRSAEILDQMGANPMQMYNRWHHSGEEEEPLSITNMMSRHTLYTSLVQMLLTPDLEGGSGRFDPGMLNF